MADVSSVGGTAFLSANQRNLDDNLRQIASGSRLSSSGGSAAELAISTVLSGEDVVLSQSAVNASQGVSVAQVADGGLEQIGNGLERLRELAALAGNGALDDAARSAVDQEFQQILTEIENTASETRFNGQSLLDNESSLNFQVGAEAGDTVSLATSDVTSSALGIDGLTLSNPGDSAAALTAIESALDTVAETRSELGATIERFQFRAENVLNQQEALGAARSALADSDLAAAISRAVSASVQFEGQAFATAQANKSAQQLLGVLS